jgi:hypothetical protein
MKSKEIIKYICLILTSALIMSGCASTTLLTTEPEGATVFIKEEVKGTTPYIYSDSKIIFSSTPIIFRKDGYRDLNIILKKDEIPAPLAIISGAFFYIPLLWAAEYKGSHFYELEKINISDQSINVAAKSDTDSVPNPNTLLTPDQIERHIEDTLLITNNMDSSSVNQLRPGMDFTNRTISQFGAGIGITLKGAVLGVNYVFIGSNKMGAGVSYHTTMFKTSDVPIDFDRLFIPKDYVNGISLDLMKVFPIKNKSRFSLSAGPSWIWYSKAEIESNPNYDPNYDDDQSWFWNIWNGGSSYKYRKTHNRTSTIGASIIAKMEFPYSPSGSLGLELFTNINSLQTLVGAVFLLSFGDVRD